MILLRDAEGMLAAYTPAFGVSLCSRVHETTNPLIPLSVGMFLIFGFKVTVPVVPLLTAKMA
jgi:hypothetical protein